MGSKQTPPAFDRSGAFLASEPEAGDGGYFSCSRGTRGNGWRRARRAWRATRCLKRPVGPSGNTPQYWARLLARPYLLGQSRSVGGLFAERKKASAAHSVEYNKTRLTDRLPFFGFLRVSRLRMREERNLQRPTVCTLKGEKRKTEKLLLQPVFRAHFAHTSSMSVMHFAILGRSFGAFLNPREL